MPFFYISLLPQMSMKSFKIFLISLIITVSYSMTCVNNSLFAQSYQSLSHAEIDSIAYMLSAKNNKKWHKPLSKNYDFLVLLSQNLQDDAVKYAEKHDFLNSAISYFHALDAETSIKEHHAASSNNDIERLTDIYIGLGDIFADINSLKTASYYYDNALMLFEDADDNESVITLLITMGKLYDDNHIPDIALLYYEMAEEKNDIPQYLADKIDFCKITALYELGDIKTADSIFMSIDPADKNDMDFHKVSYLYFYYKGNYDEALQHLLYCFENGDDNDKLAASELLAAVYFELNDKDNELLYTQYQAKATSAEIRKTPLKLQIEKLHDDYQQYKIQKDTEESLKHDKIRILFLILVIVTLSLIIIVFIIRRKKIHNRLSEVRKSIHETHESLKTKDSIIESKDKIIDDMSKKIEDLSSRKDAMLYFEESYNNFINCEVIKSAKAELKDVVILTKTVQDFSRFALTNNQLSIVIKAFNDNFPNLATIIRKNYESITTSDFKFMVLSFAGFSDIEIAVLLNLTYSAANKRSNKIKSIFDTKDDLNHFMFHFLRSQI